MFDFIHAEWIVLAAGGAYIIGYLIINQVVLRLLFALGTLLYIWYYAVALEEPAAAIWTSVLMGTANLIGLFQLYYRSSKYAIPAQHRDIYPLFSSLPPGDFRNLMKSATRNTLDQARLVTKEGEAVAQLVYVIAGEIKAEKLGQSFKLPPNIFVGEVAYMTGRESSATTLIEEGAEILEWSLDGLKQKSAKDQRFKLALEAVISNDLADKVAAAIASETYLKASAP